MTVGAAGGEIRFRRHSLAGLGSTGVTSVELTADCIRGTVMWYELLPCPWQLLEEQGKGVCSSKPSETEVIHT